MRDKERLRKCHRLKWIKEAEQLNGMQDTIKLGLQHKRDISGNTDEMWMKAVDYLIVLHKCKFPGLDNCTVM